MEDVATAEISRSQLWQWRVHGVGLADGGTLTPDRYAAIRDEELAKLREVSPDFAWTDAAALLDELVLSDDFAEFLTLDAYDRLSVMIPSGGHGHRVSGSGAAAVER